MKLIIIGIIVVAAFVGGIIWYMKNKRWTDEKIVVGKRLADEVKDKVEAKIDEIKK